MGVLRQVFSRSGMRDRSVKPNVSKTKTLKRESPLKQNSSHSACTTRRFRSLTSGSQVAATIASWMRSTTPKFPSVATPVINAEPLSTSSSSPASTPALRTKTKKNFRLPVQWKRLLEATAAISLLLRRTRRLRNTRRRKKMRFTLERPKNSKRSLVTSKCRSTPTITFVLPKITLVVPTATRCTLVTTPPRKDTKRSAFPNLIQTRSAFIRKTIVDRALVGMPLSKLNDQSFNQLKREIHITEITILQRNNRGQNNSNIPYERPKESF